MGVLDYLRKSTSQNKVQGDNVCGLAGQWIGAFSGTKRGTCILDLDDADDCWEGHAFAFDEDQSVPSVVIAIRTDGKRLPITIKTREVAPLDSLRARVLTADDLHSAYGNVSFPTEVQLNLSVAEGNLLINWESNIGTTGEAELRRPNAELESAYQPIEDVTTWEDFMSFALALPHQKYIFRGQGSRHRLRTSFHRSRRKDLVKYLTDDLTNAHHVLTAQTSHLFRLRDAVENAAFLNLLQHHGFPTPLLDWTHSPFVAAFFAYRFGRRRGSEDDKVRIFVFDRAAWTKDFRQVQTLAFAQPHFSLIEALTLENPRALPQQSISTVTNVDDIETYIRRREEEMKKSYLRVIDLPYCDRRRVMEQLRKMGITAGSLFPGLDGACEELRGRFFHPLA